MLGWFTAQKADYEIVPMELDDTPIAARLHAAAFARGWTDGEFASLMGQPAVFGFIAVDPARPRNKAAAFVLVREVASEAEILSIAVDATARQAGLGWRLMQAAMREARGRGGEEMFLEVDETNDAALALYRKLGFSKVGERKAYYLHAGDERTSAFIFRRELATARKP